MKYLLIENLILFIVHIVNHSNSLYVFIRIVFIFIINSIVRVLGNFIIIRIIEHRIICLSIVFSIKVVIVCTIFIKYIACVKFIENYLRKFQMILILIHRNWTMLLTFSCCCFRILFLFFLV